MEMGSYIICSFVSEFFYSVQHFCNPSKSFHVLVTIFLICVSFQDTFDRERQKDSNFRDEDLLDSDVNSTRNQLNKVQDE
jgi:hypothetical protein